MGHTGTDCERKGSTAVVSGREIQRFFSLHSVLHGFVFYAADRELLKELTVEFPKELLKELPEMYQVGFILTKLAASMVNIAIFAASMAC